MTVHFGDRVAGAGGARRWGSRPNKKGPTLGRAAALPAAAQVIVNILPLSHAIALIRPLVAGTPLTDPLLHVGVLLGYAVVGFVAATVFIRRRLIR